MSPGDREQFRELVRGFVLREYLEGEEDSVLSDDTPLITGGILDSIASVKLITFIEEQTGVSFEALDVKVENLDSVSRIVGLIETKLRKSENGR